MKIGIVCYPTHGGSGVVASQLAIGLAKKGHEIHIISYAPPFRLRTFYRNIFVHEIEVATWPVYNDLRLRIDRRFQVRRKNDGETLLRALIHYVCIDLQTGRAKRMPAQFATYTVAPEVSAALAQETTPYQPGVEPR